LSNREDAELGQLRLSKRGRGGWIEVVPCLDPGLLRLLKRDLDDGESEVIALAVEQKAMLVLLDETEARRTADLYGLSKTGIVGVLIRAKQERLIESLKTELDRLLNQGGFWIEERLYKRALKAVGES
jgi:predicted nucleic acid-binding protein